VKYFEGQACSKTFITGTIDGPAIKVPGVGWQTAISKSTLASGAKKWMGQN